MTPATIKEYPMNLLRHHTLLVLWTLIVLITPKPFSHAGEAQDLLTEADTAYQQNQ